MPISRAASTPSRSVTTSAWSISDAPMIPCYDSGGGNWPLPLLANQKHYYCNSVALTLHSVCPFLSSGSHEHAVLSLAPRLPAPVSRIFLRRFRGQGI